MKGRYLLFLILPSIAKLTFDRSDRISFKMVNTFVSIIDIGLSEILFRSSKFYLFDLGLLIQLYSLFFSLLLFVFIGKQKIPDIRSKIKTFYSQMFLFLSSKQNLLKLLPYILIIVAYLFLLFLDKRYLGSYSSRFRNNISTYFKREMFLYSICYIILYFTVLFYMRKKNILFSTGLALMFISFFPIISIEYGLYDTIGDSDSFARVASINPLIEALMTTIESFFNESSIPNLSVPLNDIKFYTLIQISLALIIFPSIIGKTKIVK
jgi:hypothetical protein